MKLAREIRRAGLIAVVLAALLTTAPKLQPQESSLIPVDLEVSFTRSSFLGVNETDAMAAFKVFTKRVGEKRGYRITPYIRIFEDLIALKAEMEQGTQDLVIIEAWEYLSISPVTQMAIEFAAVEQGVVREEYVVLTGPDSTIASLSDLEDKYVIVLESSNANTGKYWLLTELLELGVGDPHGFFSRYEVKQKPSQVVLPLFFGRADACVVDRSAFEIMAEMNPQVGKRLKIVLKSPPYMDTIACVRLGGWETPNYREDLIGALEELQNDPAGRQIMTLFKFEGLARFDSDYLDTVRQLHQRHEALKAKMTQPGKQARVR
jgi:phosphonate transport system substrate-binding protein